MRDALSRFFAGSTLAGHLAAVLVGAGIAAGIVFGAGL